MTIVQRRLISLAILLPSAALAWAVGTWLQERQKAAQSAAQAASKVFSCSEEVTGIELVRAGNKLALTRATDAALEPNHTAPTRWRVVAPIAASGDDDTIGALIEAACDLRNLGSIDSKPNEPPLSLQDFGLAPAKTTLTLRFVSGHSETVAIGDKSEFDGSLYVQPSADNSNAMTPARELTEASEPPSAPAPVQRVDGGFAFQIERDVFSLRDKRLLAVAGREVSRLAVATGDARANGSAAGYALRRQGSQYFLTGNGLEGNGVLADAGEATALFDQVASVRASKFVEEAPSHANLSKYGLDSPAFTVVLGDGNATRTLRLGTVQLGDKRHVFAQADGPAMPVAEVAAESLLDTLARGVEKLRDMRLLHVAADEVAGLDIASDGQTLALRSSPSTSGGAPEWRVAGEGHTADELDQAALRALVFHLTNLRADTLGVEPATEASLAAAKLATPDFVVRLQDVSGKAIGTLRIGAPAAERRPAQGDDGPIGQIFAGAIANLSVRAADYAAKPDAAATSPSP